MEFRSESPGEGVLLLDGELTIEQAGKIKSLLTQALQSSDKVRICLREPIAVDLTCLQLLCSAHRTAVKLGKHLILDDGKSEIFGQALKDAGFCRSRDCQKDPLGNCFWTGGEQP